MQVIEIDASQLATHLEFIDALRQAIVAPDGHGSSGDAFVDSMIWGGMNGIEPPYEVRVAGLDKAPAAVNDCAVAIADAVRCGREWRRTNRGEDIEVSIVIVQNPN